MALGGSNFQKQRVQISVGRVHAQTLLLFIPQHTWKRKRHLTESNIAKCLYFCGFTPILFFLFVSIKRVLFLSSHRLWYNSILPLYFLILPCTFWFSPMAKSKGIGGKSKGSPAHKKDLRYAHNRRSFLCFYFHPVLKWLLSSLGATVLKLESHWNLLYYQAWEPPLYIVVTIENIDMEYWPLLNCISWRIISFKYILR